MNLEDALIKNFCDDTIWFLLETDFDYPKVNPPADSGPHVFFLSIFSRNLTSVSNYQMFFKNFFSLARKNYATGRIFPLSWTDL